MLEKVIVGLLVILLGALVLEKYHQKLRMEARSEEKQYEIK